MTQVLLTRHSPAYLRVTFDHPPLNVFGPETIPQFERGDRPRGARPGPEGRRLRQRRRRLLLDALRPARQTRGDDGPSAGTHWPATAPRHVGATQPGARRVHRFGPGACHGSRQRARVGQRHALREPGEGGLLAVGGGRRLGARRRPDGTPAAPDRPRPSPRSPARGRRRRRRTRGAVRLRQPIAARRRPRRLRRCAGPRISSFDKTAIAETKRLVDVNSLPPDSEIAPEWDAFLAALGRPAAQERIKTLLERGLQQPGDVETRLGHHLGLLNVLEESVSR